jgi:hypothetical protein
MAPSKDEIAAGVGPSRLRASAADRELVIEVLKAAFVQGRLAKDELTSVSATYSRRRRTRTWPSSLPISPLDCEPRRRSLPWS